MADPAGIISIIAWASTMAWRTYQKCQSCPGEYATLRNEAKEMANVLQDLKMIAEQHPHLEAEQAEFTERARGCARVLEELENEVDRYKSLGTHTRRTSDRLAWDRERVRDLRNQMTSAVTRLSNFYQRLLLSSTVNIERALLQLLSEIQQGQRPTSSVSSLTIVGQDNQEEIWPELLRDLEDVGLSREVAQDNQEYIVKWFREALEHETMNGVRPSEEQSASSDAPAPESVLSDISAPAQPGEVRYMESLGEQGAKIEADVKKRGDTFQDDVNLAREYWDRKDWRNAIKYLVRVLVASQLPGRRRRHIKARTAAFLLGVAHTWSGDFETAIRIFVDVLRESRRQTYNDSEPPRDDGEVAAATWLGDICLRTNRREDAVMFYAIALDGMNKRFRSNTPTYPPPSSPRAARAEHRQSSQSSLSSFAGQAQGVTQWGHNERQVSASFNHERQSSILWDQDAGGPPSELLRVHKRGLAVQLFLADEALGNIDDLLETVESNQYLSESVLADSGIFGTTKTTMYYVNRAYEAVSFAREDVNAILRSSGPGATMSRSSILKCLNTPTAENLNGNGSITTSTRVTPAEDYLCIPVQSYEWPLLCDPHFSHSAALEVIRWFHKHTTIPGEGILFGMKSLDAKASRAHDEKYGKPYHDATQLDPKKQDHVKKYVVYVGSALSQMGLLCREAPAEFRCRPRTTEESKWPHIAAISIRIISYKPEGHFKKERLAFYPGRVIYWDGTIDESPRTSGNVRSFLEGLSNRIEAYEAESKGNILPNTRSSVAWA